MPLILASNSASGGYEVDNSLRFNAGSSDFLNKTFGTATNRKIFTISVWTKRSILGDPNIGATGKTMFSGGIANSAQTSLEFTNTNVFSFMDIASPYSAYNFIVRSSETNLALRDLSAWYHLVVAYDSTQATASNRLKLYLNGSQVTSFSATDYPTLNYEPYMNNNIVHRIGNTMDNTFNDRYYDGYLSEFNFIDGQALTPSSFGQTDPSTPSSGIWIPKAYTGSYGNNGFYQKYSNSAALGTDSSGNGNNFTVNNLTSVDQSTDTCTNNFATLNPLDINGMTFTEGNLLGASVGATWKSSRGTIGMSQGKWYWEMKATTATTAFDGQIGVGLFSLAIASFGEWTTANPSVIYSAGDGSKWVNGVNSAYGATWTTGDIIGVAFDADNLTVTFYKNGASQGLITPGFSANTYAPEVAFYGRDGGTTSGSFNFGSPAFTIASGNADAEGFGNFEYAVPSGYFALCTKNLANFG